MKRKCFILVVGLLSGVLGLVTVASAAIPTSLVPPCDFFGCDLSKVFGTGGLIDNILQWLVGISLGAATLAIVWAGITMIINVDNPSKREAAKGMIWTAIKGLVLVLAAYVIVKTVVDFFVVNPSIKGQLGI